MKDWALIRRLAAEGVPKARIARRLRVSGTTVINAIASDGPPKYERKPGPTSFTPYEARVRELLEERLTGRPVGARYCRIGLGPFAALGTNGTFPPSEAHSTCGGTGGPERRC